MSRKVFALIGCSKKKKVTKDPHRDMIPARELYTSDLFKKRVSYVENRGIPWFLLSAKSGCVAPGTPLHLYNITMSDKLPIDIAAWHVGVVSQLLDRLYYDFDIRDPRRVSVELHAGAKYCNPLEKILKLIGVEVTLPVKGMGIGKQLDYYSMKQSERVSA